MIFQSILQRNLIRDHMIEQREHVITVSSVGSRRHAEIKRWLKIRHDLLVAGRSRAMRLVNYDVVEEGRIDLIEMPYDG